MAKQFYGYGSSYGGPGLSSAYASRAGGGEQYLADASLVGSSRYLGSDHLSMVESAQYAVAERSPSPYVSQSESLNYSASQVAGAEGYSSGKYSGGIGGGSMPSLYSQFGVMDSSLLPGMKRPSEALFHQTLMGNHNSIGQNEALFSTNPLLKRPRFEIGSHLPIYPQRPGEKDCAHYMLTRTCKFGDNCKFDHPLWVPEGGIPDWKEVPVVNAPESLPERPGEPDCPYFMKTQRCKFGPRCKFNHPKDKVSEMADVFVLPERPSEPICSYYAKTGKCKFGANCIFNHPKDLQLPSSGQDPVSGEQAETTVNDGEASGEFNAENPLSFTPALLHNSKGLPVRPGEQDCPFYLKTGSCKYGATCRYNHPDRNAFNPIAASAFLHSPSANLSIGVINPAVSLLSNIDTRFSQTSLGVGPILYPQRPGQTECDFYIKTGQCKFGERCKFHHPIDRSALASSVLKQSADQSIKLTPAGLPRREGAIICPYYMKTGTCKFGASCKFDHPTPAEAIAMAAAKDASASDATAQGEEVEDPVQEQAQLE